MYMHLLFPFFLDKKSIVINKSASHEIKALYNDEHQ